MQWISLFENEEKLDNWSWTTPRFTFFLVGGWFTIVPLEDGAGRRGGVSKPFLTSVRSSSSNWSKPNRANIAKSCWTRLLILFRFVSMKLRGKANFGRQKYNLVLVRLNVRPDLPRYGQVVVIFYWCAYRGGNCPSRQCRRQSKIFASGVNFSIFTHFLCFFLSKTVEIR